MEEQDRADEALYWDMAEPKRCGRLSWGRWGMLSMLRNDRLKNFFLFKGRHRQKQVDSQDSRSITKQNDLSIKGRCLIKWSNFGLL
jgi:hypothetical protein